LSQPDQRLIEKAMK